VCVLSSMCVCGGVGVRGWKGCRNAGFSCAHVAVLIQYDNAQSPCCLRSLVLHLIFRRYLINGSVSGENLLNIKCVF
jgi:hypothetical protein